MSIQEYAEDRDAALVAFVNDGDFAHLDRLTEKWGTAPVPHTDVGAAAVYKAVQECTRIPESVKRQAMEKCVELGFSPWMW